MQNSEAPVIEPIIVIGASAGGLNALEILFSELGSEFSYPIVVCKHISVGAEQGVIDDLVRITNATIVLSQDKTPIKNGQIYIAPGNYHLQVESKGLLSLSIDERVCHSRPSIDVLFETAAEVYNENVTAIVMTGASSDGAKGVEAVKHSGGIVIVQSPASAEAGIMPKAAINTGCADYVLDVPDIANYLKQLNT
ncbi:hypothetical protein ACH42_06620 [Endozoicomonas sp. (ex Bugula neritina AB1)]|nr:hypothetical protein ACH42_06620 [Endozoicomonas sp. (ex Bugula neritina AB1)]